MELLNPSTKKKLPSYKEFDLMLTISFILRDVTCSAFTNTHIMPEYLISSTALDIDGSSFIIM